MNNLDLSALLRKAVHLLFLRPFIALVFGVNIVGRSNLTSLDQCIMVANHNSHLDILLLFYLLARDKITTTHPVAERVYFSRSRIIFAVVDFLLRPVRVEGGRPGTEVAPDHAI
ncbi:MAG: hypothetical protein GY869_19745, partial [Planctomycetes bacterium]|nr:hypothetical protein [Planctomycetota bacterium]